MPTYNDAQTYYEWLTTISTQELQYPTLNTLRLAWNAGVNAACYHFGCVEGVDHGASDALIIDEA